MIDIIETTISGAFKLYWDPKYDSRGYFCRTWCTEEARALRLKTEIKQTNLSHNEKKATLRGMHLQIEPYPDAKVVSCIRGKIYDVILDLRPLSPTFGAWEAFELDEHEYVSIYVPEGCAHGFQTMCNNTDILYYMMESYRPELCQGVRFDSPDYRIVFPYPEKAILSEKDLALPNRLEPKTLDPL